MHLLPGSLRKRIELNRLEKEKQADLRQAARLSCDSVNTLCLALGPYRNLTTLTASILFLHPHCQVLNHGAQNILGDPRLDFLLHPQPGVTNRFIGYAIAASQRPRRGKHGGSILHSHAFDPQYKMGQLYRQAHGQQLVKPDIKALFWKESLRTAQHLRKYNIDIGQLLQAEPRLRFLLPIRNPLDCALSNQRTGHAKLFGLAPEAPLTAVLDAILSEIAWTLELQQRYPDRFFHFSEKGFNRNTATRLASFLGLDSQPQWLELIDQAFSIDKHYQHTEAHWQHYESSVLQRFRHLPQARELLLDFLPDQ